MPNADAQAQLGAAPATGEVVSAKLEYGYFVTLGGLLVAIAGSALALTGRRSSGAGPE